MQHMKLMYSLFAADLLQVWMIFIFCTHELGGGGTCLLYPMVDTNQAVGSFKRLEQISVLTN